MERRDFFKLAGTSAAVLAVGGALFGCDAATKAISKPETSEGNQIVGSTPISFAKEVDVLIVGSGIAGLSAAMDPIEAKRSVLIVEKLDLLGGESYEANGLFHVSGTEIQYKAGITTTAEDAWKARKKQLEDEGNTEGLSFKHNLIVAQAEWVNRVSTDYQSEFADPKEYASGSVNESILLPKKGIGDMDSVMTPIKNVLTEKGVDFTLGMHAEAFILDANDKPAGMRFRTMDAIRTFDVKAKKIIIATGGFASSQPLMNENLPDQVKIGCYTIHSMGEGLKLCQTLGATTADMNDPALLIGDLPQVSTWGLFGPTMNLSPFGERFAREDQVGKSATECVAKELGFWWTVFDGQLSKGSQSRDVALNTSKHAARFIGPFDTTEALANVLKISKDTLDKTFETYGKSVEAKKDSEFGRELYLQNLSAPYYALKQFPVRYKTLGGVKTNDDGQLLGAANAAIENV
ncbi:MAG: FAD-dependent oxidoreductase, partial [Raoultibacter sp.]